MRNVHLIPTKNKSHLCSVGETDRTRKRNRDVTYGCLHFSRTGVYSCENFNFISYMNLYITSDEEMEEGDWCYRVGVGPVKPKKEDKLPKRYGYKIVLTTDLDLIDDFVQPIPDDFLEWYVKNITCDNVDIKTHQYRGTIKYCPIIPYGRHIESVSIGEETVDIITYDDVEPEHDLELMSKMLLPERNGFSDKDRGFWIEGASHRQMEINCLKMLSNQKYSEEELRNAVYQAVVCVGTWDSSNIVEKIENWWSDFEKK